MSQPGARIRVRLQPRSSRNEFLGLSDGILRARVTAPPERGKANNALVELLAATLGVARSSIRILRGHSSRDKWIAVDELSQDELHRRLKHESIE